MCIAHLCAYEFVNPPPTHTNTPAHTHTHPHPQKKDLRPVWKERFALFAPDDPDTTLDLCLDDYDLVCGVWCGVMWCVCVCVCVCMRMYDCL